MNRTRTIAAATLSAALAGCATTQIDAQWANPEYSGRTLRGAPVLVACEAREPTLQRICEDQVAGQVTALGGVPTRSTQVAGAPIAGTDPHIAAARGIGARAIVRTTINTGAYVAGPSGPTVGIGIGGGGGGRGGWSGGFGGISFPVGGTQVSNAYTSETAVIDPSNGAIMWSARASSTATQDATAQIAELAKTTAGALRQAGFY